MSVAKPIGGISGENGRIAVWGADEDGQQAVDVYRRDAAERLARQGSTMPSWVSRKIISGEFDGG